MKLAKWLYYGGLAILAIIGLGALGYRLMVGMRVTALTSYMSWGLWVAFYIYFIGLSAGSFLLSTMIYVFNMRALERVGRLALLSAFFALGGGLLFIWIDLGHPLRFWEIFLTPQFTSIMTIESWLYLVYLVLIVAELWLLMRDDLAAMAADGQGWRAFPARLAALGYQPPVDEREIERQQRRTAGWIKTLGIIGIPTAIGVHGGTGAIFAVVIARPYWNSGLFPIIFLVSALASGAALVTFLYGAFGPKSAESTAVLPTLGNLTALFIGLDLLLLAFEVVVGLYGGVPEHVDVFATMFLGPYPYVFWLGQLGLAGVLPLAMLAVGARKNASLAPNSAGSLRPQGSVGWGALVIAVGIALSDAIRFMPRALAATTEASGSASPSSADIAFWAAQVILATCLIAYIANRWGSTRFWLAAAGFSTVAGIVAVRLNIVIPGFATPVLAGLPTAYVDPRLSYSYFPSVWEFASTIGLVALLVLVFSLFWSWLPLFDAKDSRAIDQQGGMS